MADRNLEIALRIKADLESARKQLDDLNKSVKATGDNSKASADKLGAVSDRIGEMEAEATAANKALGQTDKVTQTAATSTGKLGREVAQLASNLGSGNFSGAAGNITRIGQASGVAAERAGVLTGVGGAAVAVLALLAVGAFKGYQETERLRVSLIATGGAAGVSAADLNRAAVQVGAATGRYGDARTAIELLAASGKVASAGLGALAQQAVDMSIVTGESVDKSVAKIIEIGERPAAAIANLNEQYHFLTAAQYAQIAAMEAEGNVRGAARLANQLDAQAMADRARDVQDNAGLIERAAHGVKSAWDEAWDSIKGIGRTRGLADQVKAVQDAINLATQARVDPTTGNWVTPQDNGEVAKLRAQLADLRRQQVEAGFAANAKELDARGNAASIAAQQRTAQFLPADVKRDNALKQANADRLAKMYGVVDPEQKALIERTYQNQVKAANDAYAAATKGPRTSQASKAPDNTKQALAAQQDLITMLQQLQGQLDPTAAAWAKYNATVDQATAKAALAKQTKGANIAGIDAERTAVVQLAAVMRDAQLDAIAKKDRDAWEQLRASLRTPAEVRVETAVAQIAELNRLIAAGVDMGGKYKATLDTIGRNAVTPLPSYQGLDATVGGTTSELAKNLQAERDLRHAYALESADLEDKLRTDDLAKQQVYLAAKAELDRQYAERSQAIESSRQQLILVSSSNFFGGLAQLQHSSNSKMATIGKAAAVAQAVINTYQSATASYAALAAIPYIGPALGAAAAAAAIAAGLANVAQIRSQPAGFADGGYTGPGGKYQVAGVVHAQEHVTRSEVVRQPGARPFLDDFNRVGMSALAWHMPGYADGGFVHPLSSAPPAPGFSAPSAPGMTAGGDDAGGGNVTLHNHNYIDIDDLRDRIMTGPKAESHTVNHVLRNSSTVKQGIG